MLLAPPAVLFGFLSFLPPVSSAEPPSPLHPKPEAAPTFEWAISAGGTLHDKTRGMALDAEGNVLLTGEFTGTATFGEHSLTSVGAMDFFVAKVDSRGKFLWVRSGGGEKIDRSIRVGHRRGARCASRAVFDVSGAETCRERWLGEPFDRGRDLIRARNSLQATRRGGNL